MNLHRPVQIGLLAASMLLGSVALAQQAQPQGSEEHGAHHGGPAPQESQKAPSGGMMGGTMGKDGQGGMKGQGGMMGRGKDKMSGGCPMMAGMKGKGGGMMMHSRPMMEGRLAYIKADLEITEAQTAAWDAYAEAVRARHASMQDMHTDMMKAMKAKTEGSALERMDARIKATEGKLESLKALKPPTEALYAVLTEVQKEKADKLLGGGCGMM